MRARLTIALSAAAAALACSPPEARPTAPQAADHRGWIRGDVVIRTAPDLGITDAEALAARAGAYGLRTTGVPGWWRLQVDPRADVADELDLFARASGVVEATPNRLLVPHRRPNDSRYIEQYAHRIARAEVGWDVEVGDRAVIVAVIGTGVSVAHQDLSRNIFTNGREVPNDLLDNDGNGLVDDVRGWDFLDGDADANPVVPPRAGIRERLEAAHETMAAGVIGAVGDNGAGVVGVAWDVSLLPIRFDYSTAGSAEAIAYAADLGADVVNMSYGSAIGGEESRDPLEEAAVDAAVAAGVVLVGSAGNDSVDLVHFPAAYDNVIAVAATDRDDERAAFSNYGSWVDVTAPGVDILSTFIGGGYAFADGTSFSGPYVAGLAALIRAAHPTWSPDQVRRTIVFTGEKLYADHHIGTRVDVGRALAQEVAPSVFARFLEPFSAVRNPRGAPLPLVGIAIGTSYVVEVQKIGEAAWQTMISSSTRVDGGPLGVLDTTGLDLGEYRVRLRVSAGDVEDVDWLSMTLVQGSLPGWPAELESRVTAPVTAGDLDGDGLPEVVALLDGPRGPQITVLDARGVPRPGWPVALGGEATVPAALGDLDGDGRVEVVFADPYLRALRADGTEATVFPAAVGAPSAIALGDVDGDRRLDVVVTEQSGAAWALSGSGVVLPGSPMDLEVGLAALVVADLDGDAIAEIAATGARRLHIVDGFGRSRLTAPVFVDGTADASLVGADIDGDGLGELVVARDYTREIAIRVVGGFRDVTAFEADGARVRGWPFSLARREDHVELRPAERVPLAAADVDGDGTPEVITVSDDGEVHVLRGDASSMSGWPARGPDRPAATPAAGDLDGDGRADILTLSAMGAVAAFDARGRTPAGFPLELGPRATTSPVVTDLDGDGDVDFILGGGAGVHAYRVSRPHRPGGAGWPLPRRDSASSGFTPASFPLTIEATTQRTLTLRWDGPRGSVEPALWRIERDDRVIARQVDRSFEDEVERADVAYVYRVIALDGASNVVGRSLDVRATATELWCAGGDGRACDDGDACSMGDTCRDGECSGTAPAPDGARCDDGNACTLTDRCAAGTCTSTTVRACAPAAGGCTAEACEPATGRCVVRALAEGAACDDGNACTSVDSCWLGECRGDSPVGDGLPCDDGNACTRVGVCRAGRCEGAFPLVDGATCAFRDPCQGAGTCREATCVDVVPLADGALCDDGDKCTVGDACRGAACVAGVARACGEPAGCSGRNSCQPRTGECVTRQLPDYAPCDDGSACTQWDVCLEGSCTGQAPVECRAAESCEPVRGTCVGPVVVVEPESCSCSGGSGGASSLLLVVVVAVWIGRRRRP